MNNAYGCAPIYFLGAILFLAGGGALIYFEHTIIGVIVMAPGVVLLVLTFLVSFILFRIKQGDELTLVVKDPDILKELQNSKQAHVSLKKQKRKKCK